MKNITIIEDDASIRDALDMILGSEHYNITLLADGSGFFEDTTAPRPDLFIIDRRLSGSDGLELCRYLKASPDYNDIPVMIISATPGIEALARAAGAEAALSKPFRIKTIREMVSRAMMGKFGSGN